MGRAKEIGEPAMVILIVALLDGADFLGGGRGAADPFQDAAGLGGTACSTSQRGLSGAANRIASRNRAGTTSAPSIQRQPRAAFQASSPWP